MNHSVFVFKYPHLFMQYFASIIVDLFTSLIIITLMFYLFTNFFYKNAYANCSALCIDIKKSGNLSTVYLLNNGGFTKKRTI